MRIEEKSLKPRVFESKKAQKSDKAKKVPVELDPQKMEARRSNRRHRLHGSKA